MPGQQLFFLLLMFGVMWFLLIRPQMKKQKQHSAMLGALEKGDSVITRGGLIGKITGLSDTVATIELQEKVRVRVLRSHIEGKYDPKANVKQDDKKKAA